MLIGEQIGTWRDTARRMKRLVVKGWEGCKLANDYGETRMVLWLRSDGQNLKRRKELLTIPETEVAQRAKVQLRLSPEHTLKTTSQSHLLDHHKITSPMGRIQLSCQKSQRCLQQKNFGPYTWEMSA